MFDFGSPAFFAMLSARAKRGLLFGLGPDARNNSKTPYFRDLECVVYTLDCVGDIF